MTLTPQQTIGQRFIIRIDFDERGAVDLEAHLDTIRRFHPGGIIAFGGHRSTFRDSINTLQSASEIPMLVTSDFERGAGQQVAGTTEFPHLMALGSIADEELVRRVAVATAREASALGVHLLFAPVLDINSNPANPIINIRAFGSSADAVAALGETFIRALQANGAGACAKHFPGHGNTDSDSHISLPAVADTMNELEARELVPFRKAAAAGVSAMMIGHMWIRCVDPKPCPASLSAGITTGLLRNTLAFKGVSISDALVMEAIASRHDPGEAALKALAAGIDLVLMPQDLEYAVQSTRNALNNENLDPSVFDDSIQRILTLKKQLGVLGSKSGVESDGASDLPKEHRHLADLVAERSIRVISGKLKQDYSGSKLITITAERGNLNAFVQAFTKAFHSEETAIRLSPGGKVTGLDARQPAGGNRHIVIASNIQPAAGQGFISFPDSVIDYVSRTAENCEVTFFSFGSPYLHHQIRADHVICCFSDVVASQEAVVRKILRG